MRYRTLGITGLIVSAIGFGTWGLGGTSYGPIDEAQSLQALPSAFERGVTFCETSDLYGDGHCEQVLGRAFAKNRQVVVLATKVRLLQHSDFNMSNDFPAGRITIGLDPTLAEVEHYVAVARMAALTAAEHGAVRATCRTGVFYYRGAKQDPTARGNVVPWAQESRA